jgi:ribosomal protein L34E
MSEISVFSRLNGINVNDHTEKKNGLTYLSWAWAWAEVKKLFPGATYTIYERNTEYGPVNYFTDGRTCWVKTGVTIEGLEHVEELPVMDFKNRSIPYEAVNSMDVNKAIQRSLTKACARHGLGLYIYAGEDLPEDETKAETKPEAKAEAKPEANPEAKSEKQEAEDDPAFPICADCGRPIKGVELGTGEAVTAQQLIAKTKLKFGRCLCYQCAAGKKEKSA